ncbi:MAG: sensor histidine kinase [Anaerolineae bacterium]
MSVRDNSAGERITIAVEQALHSEEFIASLMPYNFHVIAFDHVEALIQHIETQQPIDALVITAEFPIRSLVELVSGTQHQQILMLMVQTNHDALENDMVTHISAILSPQLPHLTRQIAHLVQQHHQNQQLQAKIILLEKEISSQRRKTSEIELLKNAIVRNVSHELRTPLLQVKSAVALIHEDPDDKKLVNYAQNAVARLEIYVKNITMLGHSLDISVNPIILRDAVEYAKRNLTRIWTRRADAERIHINLEPNLPPVLADKQGLSTVLQLLMDNALKFGNDKAVEIIGRKIDDRIYIAVRDHGIGIAQEELQDIFETFYQVDDTSTRPYGGAGVGLALVKLILENHQVQIHVNSTLNEGSTFWFKLPYINIDDLS